MAQEKTTTIIVTLKHGKAHKAKYFREDILALWKYDDDVKAAVKVQRNQPNLCVR